MIGLQQVFPQGPIRYRPSYLEHDPGGALLAFDRPGPEITPIAVPEVRIIENDQVGCGPIPSLCMGIFNIFIFFPIAMTLGDDC